MCKPNSQTTEANRKALQIYTLVKANLNREAEHRLRGFGPEVITALISEEYLSSKRALTWILELSIWVLFGITMCFSLGIEGALIAGIVCLGFVVMGCIVNAIVNVSIEGFHFKVQPLRNRNRTARRARILACRVLADTPIEASNIVGVLLLASAKLSRHVPDERDAMQQALNDQLLKSTIESMVLLTREQRDALHYRFMTVADLLETVRMRRHVPDSAASAILGVSILKAYEHIPPSITPPAHIHLIRKVAAIKPDDLPANWKQVVTAANQTLLIIGQPLRKANGRDILLRGSDSDALNAKELVRPTDLRPDKAAEELVRVVE